MKKFHLKRRNKKGFTLLEIIIVIIIISILASLALPRYYKTVEYARGLEAIIQLGVMRSAVQRYYLPRATFVGVSLDRLDVENPNDNANKMFSYSLQNVGQTTFTIMAVRTNDSDNWLSINQDGTKVGHGAYEGM